VLGPFLFVAIARRGDTAPAFMIFLVCVVVGFAWAVWTRDRSDRAGGLQRSQPIRPLRVRREHRRGLAGSGVGAVGVSLLRGSRTAMVPLWASHIGLSAATAATIFAFSPLVELGFFTPPA
jgi:hypothetical protein